MALKIGNNAVANAFVGSSQVRRAYKGGTLVYQAFGPATEQSFIQQTAPGGPAEVQKVYGLTIEDGGSLQSNKTAELRAERIPIINVWDEEWEIGNIREEDGQNFANPDFWRCKNYVPVVPGSTYNQYTDGYNGNFRHFFYDENYNYLNYTVPKAADGNVLFTVPAGAYYMRFRYYQSTNYQNCINLSDPAINGTYYPHWRGKLTLNLSTLTSGGVVVFPDGMRGAGAARDEAYGSTGVVRLGKRAYQAGDESDTSLLTDGTNTIYPLATPLTYTLDTPLPTDLTCVQGDILQRVSDNNCPFVGEMKFGL